MIIVSEFFLSLLDTFRFRLRRVVYSTFLSLLILPITLFLHQPLYAATKLGLYTGPELGYGNTTWRYLISKPEDSFILNRVVPVKVREGGFSWGWSLGYMINPWIAVEGLYQRLRDARIEFDKFHAYDLKEGAHIFDSYTDSVSLYAKFMAHIPSAPEIKPYGLVGAARVHRHDSLAQKHYLLTPLFGTGIRYELSPQWASDIRFKFYAGHAATQFRVVDKFVPFIYTVHIGLTYQLG